jgi:hypothetical protein
MPANVLALRPMPAQEAHLEVVLRFDDADGAARAYAARRNREAPVGWSVCAHPDAGVVGRRREPDRRDGVPASVSHPAPRPGRPPDLIPAQNAHRSRV